MLLRGILLVLPVVITVLDKTPVTGLVTTSRAVPCPAAPRPYFRAQQHLVPKLERELRFPPGGVELRLAPGPAGSGAAA